MLVEEGSSEKADCIGIHEHFEVLPDEDRRRQKQPLKSKIVKENSCENYGPDPVVI